MDTLASNNLTAGSRSPQFQFTAATVVLFLALLGSHMATPLYPTWQTQFTLSTTAITLIFACYPMGVTAGLLFGGRLGDQVGRRPLIFTGILLTAVSSVVYLLATGMGYLVAARLTNGVAIGLMSGPAVAAIVELQPRGDRAEGSRIGAIATLAAPAAGLLAVTLILSSTSALNLIVTLPFLFQLCGLLLAFCLVFTFRETILPQNRRSLGQLSFRPQGIWVPAELRSGFALASLSGAVAWASTGLWLALGPALALEVMGSSNRLLGGFSVVAFLTTAGVVQLFARGLGYRRAIIGGLLLIPPSLLLICVTMIWKSPALFVVGAVMAGMGQGICWMGCSELVNKITPAGIRASVLSGLYIVGYFGAAIPIIFTGIAADHLGLFQALVILSVGFCLLAAYLVMKGLVFVEEKAAVSPA